VIGVSNHQRHISRTTNTETSHMEEREREREKKKREKKERGKEDFGTKTGDDIKKTDFYALRLRKATTAQQH